MSREMAERLGIAPLAELVEYGMVAGPDPSLLHQPSRAIKRALDRAGLAVSDVDLFEINEAFAAVGVASMKDLGITDEIVNVNGGAIAFGHPIGMSGTRIVGTLIQELRRRGGAASAPPHCAAGAARVTRRSFAPSDDSTAVGGSQIATPRFSQRRGARRRRCKRTCPCR